MEFEVIERQTGHHNKNDSRQMQGEQSHLEIGA